MLNKDVSLRKKKKYVTNRKIHTPLSQANVIRCCQTFTIYKETATLSRILNLQLLNSIHLLQHLYVLM